MGSICGSLLFTPWAASQRKHTPYEGTDNSMVDVGIFCDPELYSKTKTREII